LSCWFTDYLPDINYFDQDAVIAMADSAVYWLEESGADALRLDAVKQFPHIVGTTLRARLHDELEQTGVAMYMVGETYTFTWTSDPNQGQNLIKQYVSPTELQGQFDFPLHWEMIGALAQDSEGFRPLENVLTQEAAGFYGDGSLMSPFLGNHDVPRFLSLAAGQPTSVDDGYNNPPQAPTDETPYRKLRLGMALLLTIPGLPLIYYGDEIGMPGASDPDNRRMMRFDDYTAFEQATLDEVRTLGTLRQSEVALRRGDYQTLWVDDDVLVYARHLPGSAARIVGLNRNPAAESRAVPVPQGIDVPDGTSYTDALGGPALAASGGMLPINLPGRTAAVYVPK
jgi:glycosidase